MKKKKQTTKKQTKNKATTDRTTEPWYNNTIFVLLMLITVFPIGLFLIYKNEKLRKDLWPTLKVIIACAVIIITYTLITGDSTKPTLEVKDSLEYKVGDAFGTDSLITDYVTKVNDNETELAIEDVSIVKYDDLDFSKPGTQKITFIVSDDATNVTKKTADLVISE